MSEEECSPPKCPRQDDSSSEKELRSAAEDEKAFMEEFHSELAYLSRVNEGVRAKGSAESYTKQILSQLPCNGRYSSSNPVRVTILAKEWGCSWDSWEFNSILTKELSKQLAKFPHVKVSVLVPEGSCDEIDKRVAKSHNVTIVEAKKEPGFQDPNDWLYFPPKDLTTNIVIGVGTGKTTFQSVMKMADCPVAVGPTMADNLSASLAHQKKTVLEFTPGILSEFANIRQNTLDRKKFRILVAGHDHPKYVKKEGLKIVAKAVAGLKDGSYQIVFVGAEREKNFKKFEEKFHRWGVPKHQLIIRSPPKDEEELKSWLCEADLAIMPSGEQEFSMFGLAALSSGLPILVHGASGLGEALTHVINGSSSIVESEDISEWSKAIKKVRDKVWTVRLEEADLLQRHYSEKYSWEEQCGALVEEMQKMASAQQGKTQ